MCNLIDKIAQVEDNNQSIQQQLFDLIGHFDKEEKSNSRLNVERKANIQQFVSIVSPAQVPIQKHDKKKSPRKQYLNKSKLHEEEKYIVCQIIYINNCIYKDMLNLLFLI